MLNLEHGELEWLSNHLGHTIDVHKEFYRNQEGAVQLGKVAKMLIAVDQGRILDNQTDENGMLLLILAHLCTIAQLCVFGIHVLSNVILFFHLGNKTTIWFANFEIELANLQQQNAYNRHINRLSVLLRTYNGNTVLVILFIK